MGGLDIEVYEPRGSETSLLLIEDSQLAASYKCNIRAAIAVEVSNSRRAGVRYG